MKSIFKEIKEILSEGFKSSPLYTFAIISPVLFAIFGILVSFFEYFPWTTTIAIILLLYFSIKASKRKRIEWENEYSNALLDINKQNNTNFRSENAFGVDLCFFYDNDAKMFLITDITDPKNGYRKVVDFTYIKSWELQWIDHTYKNKIYSESVVMVLRTSDIERPIIEIPLQNKKIGERFSSVLDILLA